MIYRSITKKLKKLEKQYPVISIIGPRQSGKTTLSRYVFPKHDYVNLENPDIKEFASADPRGFLNQFDEGVIIDEIQKVPSLLSYIQGIVDETKKTGMFILTGSQQFHLHEKVGQTLAGRTALITLFPFSLNELGNGKLSSPDKLLISKKNNKNLSISSEYSLNKILFDGLFPPIYDRNLDSHIWLSSYYRTFVERDLRELANIGNLDLFQKFIRICAGRNGQVLNYSSLATDCGISHTTAREWISILKAGFVITLIYPHFKNFSKRIIKSPKLYFLDTGLLTYLLYIRKPEEILHHAMKGFIFESFVLSELFKLFFNNLEEPPIYFWRDRTGHEVDFVVDLGNKLIPIEIKAGETISNNFFDGLKYYLSLKGNENNFGILIYGGNEFQSRNNFLVKPWFFCA